MPMTGLSSLNGLWHGPLDSPFSARGPTTGVPVAEVL